jgi:hypothetical protein
MPDERWNSLQWNGRPGHYEVYYLTFTDPGTGVGFWIRYTMVAPLPETGEEATCSLWFMAMDPQDPSRNVGEKVSFPILELSSDTDPFRLRINDAVLTDDGMGGTITRGPEEAGGRIVWDLRWRSLLPAYGHVHPALRRARIAKTILFLPHPELEIDGTIEIGDRHIDVRGALGGQAHLWGSKHASRWAWAHCNDFVDTHGTEQRGVFVDGVSVFVPRFGRELGPNTPVVARIAGADLKSTSPAAVMRNKSDFDLTGWRFEVRAQRRKLAAEVTARKEDLVGVTYHDPDGELAYCYNTEVADMKLDLLERDGIRGPWRKTGELVSNRHAHFEYAQREPVEGVELKVK